MPNRPDLTDAALAETIKGRPVVINVTHTYEQDAPQIMEAFRNALRDVQMLQAQRARDGAEWGERLNAAERTIRHLESDLATARAELARVNAAQLAGGKDE